MSTSASDLINGNVNKRDQEGPHLGYVNTAVNVLRMYERAGQIGGPTLNRNNPQRDSLF